jgi:hypothetical protein
MRHQLLQHRQQPGTVVRQGWIEVIDVSAGWDGAAHWNTPRRPGARAGWIFPRVACMPEGKNRARVVLRYRQAFVSLGPLIQLGSSQLPTNARETRIWPVSRGLGAEAAASRVRGAWVKEGFPPVAETALVERDSPASPEFKMCFVRTHYWGLLEVFVVE